MSYTYIYVYIYIYIYIYISCVSLLGLLRLEGTLSGFRCGSGVFIHWSLDIEATFHQQILCTRLPQQDM